MLFGVFHREKLASNKHVVWIHCIVWLLFLFCFVLICFMFLLDYIINKLIHHSHQLFLKYQLNWKINKKLIFNLFFPMFTIFYFYWKKKKFGVAHRVAHRVARKVAHRVAHGLAHGPRPRFCPHPSQAGTKPGPDQLGSLDPGRIDSDQPGSTRIGPDRLKLLQKF